MKFHVLPIEDSVAHEKDQECVCHPDSQFVKGNIVYLHHAVDGRERDEKGYAKVEE